MIPVLYAGNETNFTSNGLGRLSDAISCKVTEERNGIFELEMQYPITGIHYDEIQENRIIYAKTEDGGNGQAFMIYRITRPINGIITIDAQHISYLLNGIPVMPFNGSSLADTMSKIASNAVITCPFTFYTDIASSVTFSFSTVRSIRSLLGGEDGSILEVYGGYDYKFDNFQVRLLADRGSDNGVSLRYGKNLTELKNITNMTNVYTGIVPYWQNEQKTVYLTNRVVLSGHESDYPYKIIKVVDFSSEFEEEPTQAQLLARAQSYLSSNEGWKLKSNITVSFVNLAETEDYKDIAPLERVKLCDTVNVRYSRLGVNIKTRVIKTVYNVLLERYDSIELGETTTDLTQALNEVLIEQSNLPDKSFLKAAIENATKLIQGGLGGHVVFNTNADGEPEEILIMDTDDINTAVNVIRFNLGGIGFSTSGYEGPFDTAWTIDGSFYADFITAGNLNANLLKVGTIKDALNRNSWNLETGEFKLSSSSEIDGNPIANVINHNYVGDIFNDISLWHNDGSTVPFSYQIISGTKYLVLDCTGTSGSSVWNNVVYTKIDAIGSSKVKINATFFVDRNVTISAQPFPVVKYKKETDQQYYTVSSNLSAQTIPANTERTISATLSPTGVDGAADNYVGFYPINGCKIYIKELTVTTSMDDYASAGIEVNAKGISTSVKEGNVISSINQSAEAVQIQAAKIDLTGDLSLHGEFTTDKSTQSGYQGYYATLNSSRLRFYDSNDNLLGNFVPGSNNGIKCMTVGLYDPTNNTLTMSLSPFVCRFPKTNIYDDFQVGMPTDVVDAHFYAYAYFHNDVYDSSGTTVFVSDERKKKNIKDLVIEKARSFLMALKPREFKFKKEISKSNRYHHGFIAQEVKEVMGDDWGVYVEDKEKDFIGLRYDELMADMVAVIQDQQKRIEELERRVNDITNNKS